MRRYPFPSRLFFFSLHLFEKDQAFEFFPGSGGIDDTVSLGALKIVQLLSVICNRLLNSMAVSALLAFNVGSQYHHCALDPDVAYEEIAYTFGPFSRYQEFYQYIFARWRRTDRHWQQCTRGMLPERDLIVDFILFHDIYYSLIRSGQPSRKGPVSTSYRSATAAVIARFQPIAHLAFDGV